MQWSGDKSCLKLPGAIENKAHQKCPPAKVPAGKMRDKRDMASLGTGSHPHCRQGSSPRTRIGTGDFCTFFGRKLIPRSMQCPDSKSYRKPPETGRKSKMPAGKNACGQNASHWMTRQIPERISTHSADRNCLSRAVDRGGQSIGARHSLRHMDSFVPI